MLITNYHQIDGGAEDLPMGTPESLVNLGAGSAMSGKKAAKKPTLKLPKFGDKT